MNDGVCLMDRSTIDRCFTGIKTTAHDVGICHYKFIDVEIYWKWKTKVSTNETLEWIELQKEQTKSVRTEISASRSFSAAESQIKEGNMQFIQKSCSTEVTFATSSKRQRIFIFHVSHFHIAWKETFEIAPP